MGLVSLPVCLGLKELDKGSTLNRVMTLEIHCHGGGGGGLEGAPFHWTSLPSSLLCGVLAHMSPRGSSRGLWPARRRSGIPRGVLERTWGRQGQLFDNAALPVL